MGLISNSMTDQRQRSPATDTSQELSLSQMNSEEGKDEERQEGGTSAEESSLDTSSEARSTLFFLRPPRDLMLSLVF